MIEAQGIAVLGANGLVGARSKEFLQRSSVSVVEVTSSQLDIRYLSQVREWMRDFRVRTVVNFAAYTNVDGAEAQRGDKGGIAWMTNVEGVANLGVAAKETGKLLITIGSDFEFEGTGEKAEPYSEFSPVGDDNSLSWYGVTKKEGLALLKSSGARFAYIRIAYPFGNPASQKDFVLKTLGFINSGYPLFSDQRFTPTYIPDLAKAINVIDQRQLEGILHVATYPPTTPYEFASYLVEKLDLDKRVLQGSMVEFMKKPGRTPRPRLGGFLCVFTQRRLALRFSSWRQAVDHFIPVIREGV